MLLNMTLKELSLDFETLSMTHSLDVLCRTRWREVRLRVNESLALAGNTSAPMASKCC